MTGTTAQPSHEPPHKRKGTGTRHTDKSISAEKPDRPRGRAGGEENGRQNPVRREKLNAPKNHMIGVATEPPSMRVLKTADLGTQALLVVNSFKLHLTALHSYCPAHCVNSYHNIFFGFKRGGQLRDRQTDGQTDRQTDRQTDGQTDRRMSIRTDKTDTHRNKVFKEHGMRYTTFFLQKMFSDEICDISDVRNILRYNLLACLL